MNKSESIKNIASAISKFQSEVPNPKKVAENPFFKSSYVPLDEVINVIKPYLAKHGLSFFQSSGGDGKNITVTTMLMHESGEWIESDPLTVIATKADPQQAGSAITYARRYSLSAILGIASEEDDDGNSGSGKTPPEETKKVSEQQLGEITQLIDKYAVMKDGNAEELTKYFEIKLKVKSLEEINNVQAGKLINELNKLINKELRSRK